MHQKSNDISDISNITEQMVEIPCGKIDLRDDRTKKTWTVGIESFLLFKYPVTQALYFEVTKENPSFFRGNLLPVETVSFKDAVVFCNKLSVMSGLTPCYQFQEENEGLIIEKSTDGFRMPTEAEWEYSCKAGTKGIRYDSLELIAWYKENSGNRTHIVGQKKPNAWGLYDMLGNVWEWCSDIYDKDIYGSYRIFRGGGWSDKKRCIMSTTRRRSHPLKFKIEDLGFRIAKTNYI